MLNARRENQVNNLEIVHSYNSKNQNKYLNGTHLRTPLRLLRYVGAPSEQNSCPLTDKEKGKNKRGENLKRKNGSKKDKKRENCNSESLKRYLQTDKRSCLSFLHFVANDIHLAITHLPAVFTPHHLCTMIDNNGGRVRTKCLPRREGSRGEMSALGFVSAHGCYDEHGALFGSTG